VSPNYCQKKKPKKKIYLAKIVGHALQKKFAALCIHPIKKTGGLADKWGGSLQANGETAGNQELGITKKGETD